MDTLASMIDMGIYRPTTTDDPYSFLPRSNSHFANTMHSWVGFEFKDEESNYGSLVIIALLE